MVQFSNDFVLGRSHSYHIPSKTHRNPVFNFPSQTYLNLSLFNAQVWDWDRGNSNDLLGCARIGPGNNSGEWDDANGVEIEAWRHMIDNPNVWKEFKIKLRSELKSRNKKK